MATPGTNMKYGKPAFMWEMFFRKIGTKPRQMGKITDKTANLNMASDAGTSFPRSIGICRKVSVTAPQSNTAADAPTGIGDICLSITAGNVGLAHIAVTSYSIYRCSAYTNSTTFTWTQWFA